jgi:hypothetical protein
MSSKPKSAEIHPGPGFRVKRNISLPPQDLVNKFRVFETPKVSDIMSRLYTMNDIIKNVRDSRAIPARAPWPNFVKAIAGKLAEPDPRLQVLDDQFSSPTYTGQGHSRTNPTRLVDSRPKQHRTSGMLSVMAQ